MIKERDPAEPFRSAEGRPRVLPYTYALALVAIAAICRCAQPVCAADFLNQHRIWKHTSSALNDTYLKASYVDTYHPDSSFNHDNANDFFLYASGNGSAWWNQAIVIGFGWDSLYGYGPMKIPNPTQVDSCMIDSGWLWVQIPSWGYSDVVQITAYRAYTNFTYDGSGKLYPSWNYPKSGGTWASGSAFSRSDLYGEDSSNVMVNTPAYIRIPVAGIFNDFTDSTGRRTGIAIGVKFAHPDHDSTVCFYTESSIASSAIMFLELWWSEYGVKSTAADSQKVLVRDTEIQNYFNPNTEEDFSHYNYGAAATLQLGTNSATSVENGKVLVGVSGATDSLKDNVEIDSARFSFSIDAKTGSNFTVYCFKVRRWWKEGTGTGTGVSCGADYVHSQHATGGECTGYYGWGTAGCGNTTSDREGSAFDTVAADTGRKYFWVPDSIATGMYNNRAMPPASQTNFTDILLKMAAEGANRLQLRSQNYPGTNYDPYWVFYYHVEAASAAFCRRPAAIDEPIHRGAYLK